jgi:hypothetical protein
MASSCFTRGSAPPPPLRDQVPQELDRGLAEGTLGNVEQEAEIPQPLKHRPQMLDMGVLIWASNQHVIQVNKDIAQASPHSIHQPLECLASVAEAKRHAKKLPESEGGDYRCLLNILQPHRYLIVAFLQVQF